MTAMVILFDFYIRCKKFLRLPIYRVDVLRYVKYHHDRYEGICAGINSAMFRLWGDFFNINLMFPKVKRADALAFGAYDMSPYWWNMGDWGSGRMEYLDYLIYLHRDDYTNLSKISKQFKKYG